MEYIFRTIKSSNKTFIANKIKFLAMDKDVIKEMGEPIIYNTNQKWIFALLKNELSGFIVYNSTSILYVYTLPKFRLQNVFTFLYNQVPKRDWKVVSSNSSLPFFLKNGFKVVKSFKNCHKLKHESHHQITLASD